MGNEVTTTLEGNDHLPAQQLTAWLSAAPSEAASPTTVHAAFDDHLHTCAACRAQLVMLRQATQLEPELEASPEFDSLLRLGEQAALSAVREASMSVRAVVQPTATSLGWRVWLNWRVALPLAAMLLLAVGIPAYFYYQRNQPIERAMASLRQSWTQSRPLEARVTGGFDYLPHRVTRGSNDAAPVNQNQLMAATAELARELADQPTPKAQHYMGRLHLLKGEFARAEELLTEVVKAEPNNAPAHVDLGISIYERGIRERGNGEQYITTLTKAAEHLTKATELSPQMLEAWFNLALCQEQRMLFLQAKSVWEKYLVLDANSPWAEEARSRLQQLKEKTTLRNDLNNISSELKVAFAVNDQPKLQSLLDNNFYEVGALIYGPLYDELIASLLDNKKPEAERLFQSLSPLCKQIKEAKGDHFFSDLIDDLRRATPARIQEIASVRTLFKQGEAAFKEDHLEQALQHYLAARQRAIQIVDTYNQEIVAIRLSNINLSKVSATPEINQARAWLLTETARRHHLEFQAIALLWSANIFWSDQLFARVITASKEAFGIAQKLSDRVIAVSSLRMSAGAYSDLGNYQTALNENAAAIRTLWQQPPSAFRAYQSLSGLSNTLEKSGNYQAALDYQLEVNEYSETTQRPQFIIHSLGRTGALASQLNRHQDALAYFNQALGLSEGYNDAAGKTTLLPSLYYSLGSSLLKQGQVGRAEIAFQRVLSELGGKGLRQASAAHQGLALAYLRQDKTDQAEQELLQGIKLTESAQKDINELPLRDTFFASRADIYHTMVGLQYFQRKSHAQAFDYAEASRSRELHALLTGSVKFHPNQVADFLQYSRNVNPLTLKEVQQALPANTQLIEYAVLEDRLLIWVITSERSETESVTISANALQQLCNDYLSLLTSRSDIARLNTLGGQLHQYLIAPIAKHLSAESALVIVPDGSLQSLPFAALYNPANGRYLVQDFPITVNPSANVFVRMLQLGKSKRRSQAMSLLTLSNPQFNSNDFPGLQPIPKTEAEVASISSYYPAHLGLSQSTATRTALLKNIGDYEIVHLATHSVVNPQNPLLSSIVLTGETPEKNGSIGASAQSASLQARDIFGLKLKNTRLVILSSCQSAVNPSSTGNGLGSLSHAFFSANVPTVIASLWKVDDESTAELMKAFHYDLRIQHRSPGAALQQAQLKLLAAGNQQWRHPYYWAAFLVAGGDIGC